jgi:plastocyanin
MSPRSTGVPIAALAAIGMLALACAARPPIVAPTRHVVEIQGMAFHPQVLEVATGDTVVWINRDIVPHTATSNRKSGWDTGPLSQGKTGEYVARREGKDPYICQLHPTMAGTLIVR